MERYEWEERVIKLSKSLQKKPFLSTPKTTVSKWLNRENREK